MCIRDSLNTIDSLAETVLYALLFVVIVVFLFLGRWRATLIICITIPLSLIASFIYLAVTGNTINIISLSSLSIAIGMVAVSYTHLAARFCRFTYPFCLWG